MTFSRIRLTIITLSVLLVFIFSIFFYAYWVSVRSRDQIRAQLLERARLLTSQYVDYESLRPFMMRRTPEEVNYRIKMVSLHTMPGISLPDKFELASLERFVSDKSVKETYTDDREMGQAVFRYIRPFRQNGVVIGVSLTVSRELLLKAYRENMYSLALFSALIIFLTLALASMLLRRLAMMAIDLENKNEELLELQNFKEDLTRMLVHDLKNPLTVVIGSLNIMKEGLIGKLAEEQRKLVEMSKRSADRLLTMIMNILDISKLEEGKMELHKKEVGLEEFLGKIAQKHAEAAAAEGKKVNLAASFSDPKVSADEIILERILDNLISNSLKHTEKDKGAVEVSAVYDGPAREARISVKDNGEGIPAEYLDKVFEKFVQVESRKLGTKLDTGLGLTFCKLAVNAHGGRIWVESEAGKGSTFIFTIPR